MSNFLSSRIILNDGKMIHVFKLELEKVLFREIYSINTQTS